MAAVERRVRFHVLLRYFGDKQAFTLTTTIFGATSPTGSRSVQDIFIIRGEPRS